MKTEGAIVSDFSLPDQEGNERKLSDNKGKWTLIYFYPKDNTPGCTIEACAFRDSYREFQERGIEVLGISPDSVKSHCGFSERNNLFFPVLADTEKKVINDFGVWQKKKFMGKEFEGVVRSSFLLGPDLQVIKVYEKVNPLNHPGEVLRDFDSINK